MNKQCRKFTKIHRNGEQTFMCVEQIHGHYELSSLADDSCVKCTKAELRPPGPDDPPFTGELIKQGDGWVAYHRTCYKQG